jgi:hypothetical protein
MKLSKKYICNLCKKECITDKLGYTQGHVVAWKYGAHLDRYGQICTNCLTAIHKTIEELRR